MMMLSWLLLALLGATAVGAETLCGFVSAGIGVSCSGDCATPCPAATTANCPSFSTCSASVVSSLTFSRLGLTALPNEFTGLYSLATVDARHNYLDTLPSTLYYRAGLRKLILSNNSFAAVPTITVLNQLLMDDNKLKELPASMCTTFTALFELRVSGNQLKHLPDAFGALPLTYLTLSRNPLLDLPESFGSLTRITQLAMDYTDLTELPSTMGNMQGLTWLSLFRANFSAFPPSILDCTNLRYLDLSGSTISEIPEGIGSLSQLSTLYFSGNAITELPEALSQLPLRILHLGSNELTALPDSFGSLAGTLTNLDLYGNNLTALPESFASLTKLTRITLGRNMLDCSEVNKMLPQSLNTSCVQSDQLPRNGSTTSTIKIVFGNITLDELQNHTEELEREIEEALNIEDGSVEVIAVSIEDGAVVVVITITTPNSLVVVENLIGLVEIEGHNQETEYLRKAIDASLVREDPQKEGSSEDALSDSPIIHGIESLLVAVLLTAVH